MKRIVVRLPIEDAKTKKKALKAVAGIEGVISVSINAKEKKIIVIGDADPVVITMKLRKFGVTELISVSPALYSSNSSSSYSYPEEQRRRESANASYSYTDEQRRRDSSTPNNNVVVHHHDYPSYQYIPMNDDQYKHNDGCTIT